MLGLAAWAVVVSAGSYAWAGDSWLLWLAGSLGLFAAALFTVRRLTLWGRAVVRTLAAIRDDAQDLAVPECSDPVFGKIFDACLDLSAAVSTRRIHHGLSDRARPATIEAFASCGLHWSHGWARCELPLLVSEPADEETATREPQSLKLAVTSHLETLLDAGAVLDGHRWAELAAFFPPGAGAAGAACRAALSGVRPAPGRRAFVTAVVLGPAVLGELTEGGLTVLGALPSQARLLIRMARLLGAPLVASDKVAAAAGEAFIRRRLGRFRLGWRRLEVFELMALAGSHDEPATRLAATYQQALASLEARAWNEALALFKDCLATAPGDGPSRVGLNFSQRFKGHPPPRSWDGTLVLGVDT